jgi:predicted dehydrogenase
MRFGILSTANIGQKAVIPAIRNSDHEAAAIASRDGERAERVASERGIERAYGSYEDLLADEEIEAVYNPLPNARHAEWTRRAADAGLHVLCEKPLGVDAREAREMFDYCADRDVTLMEAFMYRFHPRTERAAEVVASELGEIRSVEASFAFPLRGRPDDVRLNPDLAGGSLMDVGCYAVSAARLFLGKPARVYGYATDTRDCGVDTETSAILEYDSGASAHVRGGFDTPNVERYRVETTDGWLEATSAFTADPDEQVAIEYGVDGRIATETFGPVDHYQLEVEQFAECVGTGRTPRIDAGETVGNMAVIDAISESAERGEPVVVER